MSLSSSHKLSLNPAGRVGSEGLNFSTVSSRGEPRVMPGLPMPVFDQDYIAQIVGKLRTGRQLKGLRSRSMIDIVQT